MFAMRRVVGDFVVVTTAGNDVTGSGSGTYVTQISTGKFWFIPAPPDTYVSLGTLSSTEIIVKETANSTSNGSYFQNYIRYDLAKLDELGQPMMP